MKRLWMSGAAAVMALSIAGVGAQTPQTQPPTQTPQTQPPATASQSAATTTVIGCVYKEADVPGRTPNVAEKAGIMEDYILVATDTSSATAGTSGTTPPTGTAGTTGSSSAMKYKAFKLENIADERLSAVVGKRVEVTGRVDAEAGDSKMTAAPKTTTPPTGAPIPDRSVGPDQIELPEFEVTTMREVEGTCPATPQIKK